MNYVQGQEWGGKRAGGLRSRGIHSGYNTVSENPAREVSGPLAIRQCFSYSHSRNAASQCRLCDIYLGNACILCGKHVRLSENSGMDSCQVSYRV